MSQYKIYIEAAEENEVLEQNYTDLMILIINSSISEVSGDEQSDNIPQSIY